MAGNKVTALRVKWWNYGLPPDWIFLSKTHARRVIEISKKSQKLFLDAWDKHGVEQYWEDAATCGHAIWRAQEFLRNCGEAI